MQSHKLLEVSLIGRTEDKIAFLKACKVITQFHSSRKDVGCNYHSHLNHKSVEYKITHNLFIKDEPWTKCRENNLRSYIWDSITVSDVEDWSVLDKKFAEVDAIIYLNATFEEKMFFENVRNPETCVAFDYQPDKCSDALLYLENIPSPSFDSKIDYDETLSLILNANQFDITSSLYLNTVPKEVIHSISSTYLTACLTNFLLFKEPPNNGTTEARLTLDKKSARFEQARRAKIQKAFHETSKIIEDESEKLKTEEPKTKKENCRLM